VNGLAGTPAFYAWGAVPPAVSVTASTAGSVASFINTLTQLDPPFTLTKTVTGGPGCERAPSIFTIDCGASGTSTRAIVLNKRQQRQCRHSILPGGAACTFS